MSIVKSKPSISVESSSKNTYVWETSIQKRCPALSIIKKCKSKP
jgi:hypothetical protein